MMTMEGMTMVSKAKAVEKESTIRISVLVTKTNKRMMICYDMVILKITIDGDDDDMI